jgi:hypothetical protein
MQSSTLNADPDSVGAKVIHPSQTDQLDQLEARVRELEQSFGRLETLQSELQDLELAYQESCGEEKRILADETATEKEATKRLLECRAKRDLRHERLLNGKRRISDLIDTITLDDGPDLRRFFARFAHRLLAEKEAAITELFNDLLTPGFIAGVNNRDLVQASAPVVRVRQIANWCNNQPHKDQQEELSQLRELPRLWLTALHKLVEGVDPFESASSK